MGYGRFEMRDGYWYKTWSNLRAQLTDSLCEKLRKRITYFATSYHQVHDSYGRAAVRLDGQELVQFSWHQMYEQEWTFSKMLAETHLTDSQIDAALHPVWAENCTYYDDDFLLAAVDFRALSIGEALASDDYLIQMFAIMDRRVGKRTLQKIRDAGTYRTYPQWIRQFYELRLSVEGMLRSEADGETA